MKFAPISVFFHRGDPLVVEIPQPKLVTKSADFSKISKKKKFFFFFTSQGFPQDLGFWPPRGTSQKKVDFFFFFQ